MNVVIVYESMYGNTNAVAHAIGEGLSLDCDVTVASIAEATQEVIDAAELVIVGGPTHIHGLTSSTSRRMAVDSASRDGVDIDPSAQGPGLRDWFAQLAPSPARAAAFDTRLPGPPILTGRAAVGIGRRLRRHGFELVAEPESFLVDQSQHLEPGERERAVEWGASLGSICAAAKA